LPESSEKSWGSETILLFGSVKMGSCSKLIFLSFYDPDLGMNIIEYEINLLRIPMNSCDENTVYKFRLFSKFLSS